MNKEKLQLILAMSIFGTIGLVRRYIPYSSSLIAFSRGLIGVLFLLLLRAYRKEKFPLQQLKDNFVLLGISGVALGVNWILLFEAYRYTTISVATVSYYMAPVFMILASPLVLGERITLKKGICAAVAVAGMVLVSGVLETRLSGLTGVLFGLGAAVLYATVVLLNKKIEGPSASERTIIQLGFAALSLLPYVLITEDFASFEPQLFAIIMLLIAGVVHTGIAYALYFGSIKNVPAQTVAIFSYIDPIVAVLLSALVLHEGMSAVTALGVVMVIGSAFVSEVDVSKLSRR